MSDNAVLARHRRLQTHDVDELRSGIGGSLTPHKLYPVSRGVQLDAELSVAPLGPISLIYAHHRGGELGAELTDRVSYYDVHLSYGGYNVVRCGGEQVVVDDCHAVILSPAMDATMRLSDEYRQLHVRVERAALERHLEGLLGRPVADPVRFAPGMALASAAPASWSATVETLVRDLDQAEGLAAHPLAVANWSGMVMTGLLLAQPHNYTELLNQPTTRRSPRTVTRALDYIDQHLSSVSSVGDIARAAGVSARSLQREFRDCVGLSPLGYVQQCRLEKVRDELLSAAAHDEVTVTDTALRWGFTHMSRFASAYRERYGESPSTTLRRTVGRG